MKKIFSVLALALTTACLAEEEGGPSIELKTKDSNFKQENLVGRTFGGTGVSIRGSSGTSINGSVRINSPTSATLTLDGESSTLPNLGGTTFGLAGGFENVAVGTRLKDGPITRDVLYIVAVDAPAPFLAGPRTSFFVDGNETPNASLPSGTVTYRGAAVGMDRNNVTTNGTSEITVQFGANSFDATLAGINAADPSAMYELTSGDEINGQLTGIFQGGDAYAGALQGRIYGSAGDQAAGTFIIALPGNGIVGAFGAVD